LVGGKVVLGGWPIGRDGPTVRVGVRSERGARAAEAKAKEVNKGQDNASAAPVVHFGTFRRVGKSFFREPRPLTVKRKGWILTIQSKPRRYYKKVFRSWHEIFATSLV
jgi:hypothetical protein